MTIEGRNCLKFFLFSLSFVPALHPIHLLLGSSGFGIVFQPLLGQLSELFPYAKHSPDGVIMHLNIF